ncbi:response regulator [Calothrix sp. PCC 7507]|uniref:response regulator n=1 Tax=Calothrix sp. PCC 7507 TaxID=99598 RepID=UPI00029F232A|nr:response regulator [Calothrix sp. PCC 7507]AFY35273.1 multi-component transcriptional regulator, winged helix family [Calothrix sp. PCC 7507]
MKILVVEDDELLAATLTAILTNHNYAVEVAIDGDAAWNLIEIYDYDLILLDVILPKLDGVSLCRQIRSSGMQMPVLLLTGRDSSHEKAIGLDAGADDYVVKPFDAEELVARVRALLRRGASTSQPVLEWGDLRLDPSSCEVTYAQDLLSLTPKEYALLELFLRNSHRVFSCGMILAHLWSYDDTPTEEAVRTHIKGLRQKLKAVGVASDLIETVYGIGYRLKPQEADRRREDTEGEKRHKEELNHAKSTVPNCKLQQQTLTAVAGIWQQFQGRVDEQVKVLEQAASLGKKVLNSEVRRQAAQEAHTLAGSLGTFGLAIGSELARKIEQLLKSDKSLTLTQTSNLHHWVKLLRQEIEAKKVSPPPTSDEQPLVLVIDSDFVIAEQLVKESTNWGLKVAVAANIETARTQINCKYPSVVLLDPSVSFHQDESLSLLAELSQSQPAVPVLVFTEQSDFANRLQLARHGVHTFLQKPMLIAQVLEAITQVLQQTPFTEAKVLAVDDDRQILTLLQTLLSPWGLKVITLDDPRKFWETLEAVKPDMLILDVEMPYINGIELCQVVRSDRHWSELPILFLTVHHDAEILHQVFSVGADDFVSKPIVGPELVTRMINRLERVKLLRCMAQAHNQRDRAFAEVALQQSQAALQKANNELELRVAERTAELVGLNRKLRSQLDERQRIQEELRISQAKFARILDIADDAIISIDSHQCITLFNQGAEKIFGYSAEEVIGQRLDLLLPPRFAQSHRHHVTDFGQSPSLARRMGERREIFGCRQDGTEFPAEASISKLNMGNEIFYTVILRDVTERKQIERMKDEFVSVVSHELRTPLTSIHGSLGMLASGLLNADSEPGKRLLQIATDSSDRLVRLINDILDIERIESGRVKMARETCNLADLIKSAVNVIQPLADKAGVQISIASLSMQLWADQDRIVQTLTNLLSNAIKFSAAESTIWLTTQKQGNEVLLAVKDTGRGIPSDKLDSIFERFQQVDSSDARNHDGTGLGLAICQSIVQQHGGHIWVESILGEGSTFYFTLPILEPFQISELEDSITEHLQLGTQDSALSHHLAPLVLVCDDDPVISAEMQTLLEQGGYRVVTVTSGQAAIALAAAQQPNVILLDLMMPGMNGWETMAVLKERANTKNIPIVICSVYKPTINSQTNADFADWVSKPVKQSYLLQSLRQVVAKSSKRVRILIVEDDNDVADLLMALFARHDIETFLAKSGREAIRLSQEVKPDLLILDLVMPESDAFVVVDWLQQHNQLCSIPVVVYSARDLEESERNRLKLGHTEFLTKGLVTTKEFEQRVMELLQKITHFKKGIENSYRVANFPFSEEGGNHDKKAHFSG